MLFVEMLTTCKSFRARPSLGIRRGVIREFKPPPLLRQASSYKHIQKCYQVLGVDEDSSLKEVKAAFVELARKYHPDSGSATASAAKFDEIKGAYESVRDHLTDDATPGHDDVNEILEKDFGIKHTVPQHRQYLSYDGVGHGSPTQRWHQYQQHRLQQAVERVHDYRVASKDTTKEVVLKDATLARQYKTTQAIERLVEDLIQESMARGEFNNLPGAGKPLKFAPENPYVDSTTRKLNEVLITNGYVPEWVVLEREIGDDKRRLRAKLADRRSLLGPAPLAADEQRTWDEAVRSFHSAAAQINRKIDKFNMLVPLLNKQQLHFSLATESEKILNSAAPRNTAAPKTPQLQQSREDEGFLSFIFSAITNRW